MEEGITALRARIVLILLALTGSGAACTRDAPLPEPGVAPADLAALEARLGPGGGLRVVNFWAMWCQPCVEELPEFVALDLRSTTLGATIIGVSLDLAVRGDRAEIEAKLTDFLRRRAIRYENWLYTDRVPDLLDAFALPGSIPHTLVLADDGTVIWQREGKTTRAEIEEVIAGYRSKRHEP